eukprot:Rhum_TRINITY_DN1131_c0_g1::Rhum_TRINITY_DN1131_c0_g1_i1::g.3452::m.3452
MDAASAARSIDALSRKYAGTRTVIPEGAARRKLDRQRERTQAAAGGWAAVEQSGLQAVQAVDERVLRTGEAVTEAELEALRRAAEDVALASSFAAQQKARLKGTEALYEAVRPPRVERYAATVHDQTARLVSAVREEEEAEAAQREARERRRAEKRRLKRAAESPPSP